jgi:hypothetical protein
MKNMQVLAKNSALLLPALKDVELLKNVSRVIWRMFMESERKITFRIIA